MITTEWISLVLRVLEFGDQTQQLFSVRCSPQIAAYYFLDRLLTGFDEDRNLENGRQVISLGGLSLLLRRLANGDDVEKSKAVSELKLPTALGCGAEYPQEAGDKQEPFDQILSVHYQ
ncbi:hypothetical protein L2E82_28957 [Cichorium intybus]|uniref:Uncharacterized protein n=1 Tax=Cichorium intybus TaxID=13427 RepID=A0ACB9CX20_CICIN|nr:hypothetical protein L2E82_28957 [Cichorium intybus]